jgi:hypothetical protein
VEDELKPGSSRGGWPSTVATAISAPAAAKRSYGLSVSEAKMPASWLDPSASTILCALEARNKILVIAAPTRAFEGSAL